MSLRRQPGSLFEVTQELEFLKDIGKELRAFLVSSGKIFLENQACSAISGSTASFKRVEHFAIERSFTHEKIERSIGG